MKHVYIIEAGNGHKKIGVAKDIKKRIRSLKTGISTGISRVLVTEKIDNPFIIESMLHELNSGNRLNGEWFCGELNLGELEFFDYWQAISKTSSMSKLISYLLSIRLSDNLIIASQEDIANGSGLPLPIVRIAFKKLIDKGTIKTNKRCVYVFNYNAS